MPGTAKPAIGARDNPASPAAAIPGSAIWPDARPPAGVRPTKTGTDIDHASATPDAAAGSALTNGAAAKAWAPYPAIAAPSAGDAPSHATPADADPTPDATAIAGLIDV